MKQDKWTKQLHDKLAEHEVAAPEGLWADIEATLPQTGAAPAQPESPRRARFIVLRRWAVAASLTGVLALGGYWWWNHEEFIVHSSSTSEAAEPSAKFVAERSGRAERKVQSSKFKVQSSKFKVQSSKSEPAVEAVEPPHSDTPEPQDETPQPEQQPVIASEAEVTRQLERSTFFDERSGRAERNVQRSTFKVQVNLYAMNGFVAQNGSNGVRMSMEQANRFNDLANYTVPSARTREPIYLTGYEEQQHHQQPVSFGLTASYPLGPRLSLTTGVVYTQLRSDFTSIMRSQTVERKQRLHYVGIPLSLSYRLWSHNGLKAYVSAGGQADWNVETRMETEGVRQTMDKDRMQWSVNGSLGVEYDIIPQLGLYAEPGIKYYFDNGSRVQNYFKDKPTSLNLQVGLRLNIGK